LVPYKTALLLSTVPVGGGKRESLAGRREGNRKRYSPFDAKEQKTHCQRIELKREFENPNLGTIRGR
jgi:hypothetical protein